MTAPKIAVVGMGFIGGFLLPAYEALLGSEVATHVHGIKATNRGLDELRARYPFPISVGDAADVLRRMQPDIIVYCAPPSTVHDIVRDLLVPHYGERRARGGALPDLYVFPPLPPVDYYTKALGGDVCVAKLLPNVVEPFGDVDPSIIGNNFVCVDPNVDWHADRLARLMTFLSPYGHTVMMTDDDSSPLLAVKTTAHTCYELSFFIQDAMAARGVDVSVNDIGSIMRMAFHEGPGATLPQVAPYHRDVLDEPLRSFVARLTLAWYGGITRYIGACRLSLPPEEIEHTNITSFALNILPIQFESRDKLEQNTRDHGTKGGVLERSVQSTCELMRAPLIDAVNALLDGTLDADTFFAYAAQSAERVMRESHDICFRLNQQSMA